MTKQEFLQYHRSHLNHVWKLINKDKSELDCNVIYFPIDETYKNQKLVPYKESRALIQISIASGFDFREVPFYYLNPNE